jgi:aminopeptidase N
MADMWVHEGFTNYSEVLYTEWLFGKEAGIDYCQGIRKNIKNDKPIIAPYGVHKQGSGDMYYKAANMIHIIRNNLHNDSLFRELLRGMNKKFYHQIVTSKQIEEYIILKTKLDLKSTFLQYLTTTQIPRLVCKKNNSEKTITVNWENCIEEFNMPLTIITTGKKLTITPIPQQFQLNEEEYNWWNKFNLERNYYIHSSISNDE